MAAFDQKVLEILEDLSYPNSDLMQDTFCANLHGPRALQARRMHALTTISEELQGGKEIYQKSVVDLSDLIDEYDLCILHWSIIMLLMSVLLFSSIAATLCYSRPACNCVFFSAVFSSLLKVCQCQCLRHCQLTSFDRTIVQCMQV
jgi:hypothetical protein